jgi:putative intracellular protease/amidase
MKQPLLTQEEKYAELILDLVHNDQFIKDVKEYRKGLGIPLDGFHDEDDSMDFEFKHDTIDYGVATKQWIRKKFAKNKKESEILLAWNDYYFHGPKLSKILSKYKLPKRAADALTYFMEFGTTNEEAFKKAIWLSGGDFGCDIKTRSIERNKPEEMKDFLKKLKPTSDICAVIAIYPEANRQDVQKLITNTWKEIRETQNNLARVFQIKTGNIRAKLFRRRYDEIMELHKKGLKSREIATELGLNRDGSWEYVRKVISEVKKREAKRIK